MSPSSDSVDREYLTRAQLAEFLTKRGYPISQSTLAKLCALARGEGPPAIGFWSNRALYDPARSLSWAKNRFRTNRRGSSQVSAHTRNSQRSVGGPSSASRQKAEV